MPVPNGSAPKAGFKRVFLITDEDDPHPGARSAQLVTSAQTTLKVGITRETIAFLLADDAIGLNPSWCCSGTVLHKHRGQTF